MGRKIYKQSSSMSFSPNVNNDNNGNDGGMKLNFSDIESTFKKFSGDGTTFITKWLDDFESAATTFNWNNMQKLIFCKRLLTGEAKLFIDCEVRPVTYERLREALCEEYAQKDCSAEVHKRMRERKKNDNEGLFEYLYCMIDIASQSDIDDISIIMYVINGIRDSPSNKSMLYGARSIKAFKEKLTDYKQFKENSFKPNDTTAVEGEKKKFAGINKRRCFNCGNADHEFHSCPRKSIGPKCFRCNNYGHRASECTGHIPPKTMNIRSNTYETFREIKINNIILAGLIDTGSHHCVIKEHLVNLIKPVTVERDSRMSLAGLVSTTFTKGTCIARVEIDDVVCENVVFHIVESNPCAPDVIIGMDLLKCLKLTIDGGKLTLESKDTNEIVNLTVAKEQSSCFLAAIDDVFEAGSYHQVDLSHLTNKNDITEVKHLITTYQPKSVMMSPIQLKIVTTDDTPVCQRPRRFPPVEQQIIDEQIKTWINDGIIVPSASNYASNVVLVKKKDGSHRLCVDFRALNRKVLREHFPLPVIEDQVDKLVDADRFSTLDLENAFFHVDIDESSRKFTSFVTQTGQYEFVKVPFGLSNSPCVFQKYINYVMKDLIYKGIVIVYIDDIVIPSKGIAQGIARLKEVLDVAAKFGLRIKWKKCQILQTQIEYLGLCVEKGMISPSPSKIKAILNFPTPTTLKKMQSFLGLANYFRRFIPHFASKAKPLTDLIRKNNNFNVGDVELEAIHTLKHALTSEPVLKIFRYGAITELHTDASKHGYGAVLLQKESVDATLHPVYYFSRKTSPTEEKYSSYELEVLAVIQAVKKFRVYLIGQPFTIITDCKAFECTMRKKDLTTRVARWALLLEEYHYVLEHRSGTQMRHVDALSRNPACCVLTTTTSSKVLSRAQQADARLSAIFEILKEKPFQDYLIVNDILYKQSGNNMLIVVPEGMKSTIIRDVHNKGHFHFQKMRDIIEQEYYIDNLQQRIRQHINNCVQCILSERKRGKSEGLLNPVPKGERPLEIFHIDHLGPMQTTKKNYRYILAVIDGFSKFSWLFPTKTLTAEEVVQKMEVIAETFGYPERLVADRGGAFTANLFKDYCIEHGIKLSHTTVGVPRGNGQVERLHSIVIGVLTKLSIDNPENWHSHMKRVQILLNATFQRAIGTTPFKLLVGTNMRTELNKELLEVLEEEMRQTFIDTRHDLRESAKLQIAKIQTENKMYYDKKRNRAHEYKRGDLVAIEKVQFGVGQKIRPKFLGPYRVIAVKGFDRYQVEKEGETEGPKVTDSCADRMKPWPTSEAEDLLVSSDDDEDLSESPCGQEELRMAGCGIE